MISSSHNLLVIFKNSFISEQAIEQEVECLNGILIAAESTEQFCKAHELVDRNHITRKKTRIIKETRYFNLRPFRFLINRN